jgi:hypothetical protein
MSSEQRPRERREKISIRVEPAALKVIERVAELHRTTPGHVARILIEDGARKLAEQTEARAA